MTLWRDLVLSRGPAAAFAAMGLFWGAFAALVPDIKPQAELSDGGFGLAMLVAAIGAVMAMWLAPWAEERLGRRALGLATLIMALSFLGPGFSATGGAFTLAMLLASAASGTLDVVVNARVAAIEAAAQRPLMNLNHAVFSVAYAMAAIFAGIGREVGFAPSPILSALSAAALVLALLALASEVPDVRPDRNEPEAPPLPWARLLPGGTIILIAFLCEQATEGWSALYLERDLGAGAAEGALGPAVLGLTMAAGRLGGHLVVQRVSEPVAIHWAATLSALGAFLAAMAPSLPVAYAGFTLLGLGLSVIVPMAFAWIGRLVPARHRTHAIARICVVGYAGFFIGPPMMGFLSEAFGLSASFSAVALLLVIIPGILLPLLRHRSPD